MTHRGPFQPLPFCDSVMFKSIGPTINPWDLLLGTGLQLEGKKENHISYRICVVPCSAQIMDKK